MQVEMVLCPANDVLDPCSSIAVAAILRIPNADTNFAVATPPVDGVEGAFANQTILVRDDEVVVGGELWAGCGGNLAVKLGAATWSPIGWAMLSQFLPILAGVQDEWDMFFGQGEDGDGQVVTSSTQVAMWANFCCTAADATHQSVDLQVANGDAMALWQKEISRRR